MVHLPEVPNPDAAVRVNKYGDATVGRPAARHKGSVAAGKIVHDRRWHSTADGGAHPVPRAVKLNVFGRLEVVLFYTVTLWVQEVVGVQGFVARWRLIYSFSKLQEAAIRGVAAAAMDCGPTGRSGPACICTTVYGCRGRTDGCETGDGRRCCGCRCATFGGSPTLLRFTTDCRCW